MSRCSTRDIILPALLALAFCLPSVYSQTARPTASNQFRSIKVVSVPSAKVWIDGVYYGKTDDTGELAIDTIASGSHTLKLRADGFKERSQPVAAAQKGEIRVDLSKTLDAAELAFQEAERLSSVDRDKAITAYERAIAARPNFPDAYVSMARHLTELGDLEEAEDAIASAHKLKPVFPEATAVLGRIYKEGGQEEKAIAAFKRAIAEGKGFQPEAYTGLGLLYKEKAEGFGGAGDFENEDLNYGESTINLKIGLKQLSGAPDSAVLYQLVGLVNERQKQYKDAIGVYEEFLRIFPKSNEATAVRSFIVQLKKAMATP